MNIKEKQSDKEERMATEKCGKVFYITRLQSIATKLVTGGKTVILRG